MEKWPYNNENTKCELIGQIIDGVEDSLAEYKPKLGDEAIIKGDLYDALKKHIGDTLENWGIFSNEVTVNTPAGVMVAYAGEDASNPGVGIAIRPAGGEGYEMPLAFVECKEEELRKEGEKPDKVFLYVYSEPSSDEPQRIYEITGESVIEALELFNTIMSYPAGKDLIEALPLSVLEEVETLLKKPLPQMCETSKGKLLAQWAAGGVTTDAVIKAFDPEEAEEG